MTTLIRNFIVLSMAVLVFAVAQPALAQIVDVDTTQLGPLGTQADGTTIANLPNAGSAGAFSANVNQPTIRYRQANNNAGVQIQGLAFGDANEGDPIAKMVSANSAVSTGLGGNAPHTVKAWVWNPSIAAEEAIVAWGHRGGPDGTNMGFHQGTNGAFGAVGHWGGGPDVAYGNGGADILPTENRWSQLAYTFDGNESRVFIDGVLNNTDAHGALNTYTLFNDNVTPIPLALGSEHDAGNANSTPIPFSGIIARAQVFGTALSDQDISDMFAAESPFFFDGIAPSSVPEPSAFALSLLSVIGLACLGWRRRRRG